MSQVVPDGYRTKSGRSIKKTQPFTIEYDDEEERKILEDERKWERGEMIEQGENDYFSEEELIDEEMDSEDLAFIADDNSEDILCEEEDEEPILSSVGETTSESELDPDELGSENVSYNDDESEDERASKRQKVEPLTESTEEQDYFYVKLSSPCYKENEVVQEFSVNIRFDNEQQHQSEAEKKYHSCLELFNNALKDGWKSDGPLTLGNNLSAQEAIAEGFQNYFI